tara:strand:- start:547 stop:927 length:381 start_codon:yes stop_codon:yes gene_type:complete
MAKTNKERMIESVSNAQARIRRRKEDVAVAKAAKIKPTRVHNFETGKPGQFLPKDQTMTIRVPSGGRLTVQKNFRDLSATNPHRIYPDADFGEKQAAEKIEYRIKAGKSPFTKSAAQRFKDRYVNK